jgi:hypothetical protein
VWWLLPHPYPLDEHEVERCFYARSRLVRSKDNEEVLKLSLRSFLVLKLSFLLFLLLYFEPLSLRAHITFGCVYPKWRERERGAGFYILYLKNKVTKYTKSCILEVLVMETFTQYWSFTRRISHPVTKPFPG